MKITVLDGYTLNPGDLNWDTLGALGELTVYERTPDALTIERSSGSPVILTNKTIINAETIAALPDLRYIGVLATGTNVVDIDAAANAGITVTNIPAYSTSSVAQLTFALLLELCHRTSLHNSSVHEGKWSRSRDFCYQLSPLTELSGKRFGVIGMGQIGMECAKIASAFGMKIMFTSRSQKRLPKGLEGRQVGLDELLSQSDVVSLNCPLTEQTRELINSENLELMKENAFLINTGRGPLVNEADLSQALHEGAIGGYATDVLSTEPPAENNPLLSAPNCIITPHIAWKTLEARTRLMATATANVKAFIDGKPVNRVC